MRSSKVNVAPLTIKRSQLHTHSAWAPAWAPASSKVSLGMFAIASSTFLQTSSHSLRSLASGSSTAFGTIVEKEKMVDMV